MKSLHLAMLVEYIRLNMFRWSRIRDHLYVSEDFFIFPCKNFSTPKKLNTFTFAIRMVIHPNTIFLATVAYHTDLHPPSWLPTSSHTFCFEYTVIHLISSKWNFSICKMFIWSKTDKYPLLDRTMRKYTALLEMTGKGKL